MNRRTFASLGLSASAASFLNPAVRAYAQTTGQEEKAEHLPFDGTLVFDRQPVELKVHPFDVTEVRLLPGPFLEAQESIRAYLRRLDGDRLLHNFRLNAGLPSSAAPLGGWEKPDCELRGHFVGHYLSACSLMHASTGDAELRNRVSYMVAELAKCQNKLGGGYLSAFPTEYFDRLNARKKVWAPFYTLHKIMAGMYDANVHCGNRQALEVLEGMAAWTDDWTSKIPEPHMQDILNTEYGGMNEVLYNLASLSSNDHYAAVGDRFTKKVFFNSLAVHRDELRGLHVNTHIPQVIGAARRYELSGDPRFRSVAEFFWWEVTTSRAYATGGTSNSESWLVDAGELSTELKHGANTTECCCAYNMLKLTRHLYEWTGDPRSFDYYERTLLNHRLAAIDKASGGTQYYLSVYPGAWKTFSTENDSFWCCTGTGIEEFSKLANSIYFHDRSGLYVNLFIASELDWREKGIKVRQETGFPESPTSTLLFQTEKPVHMPLHVRIPSWAGPDATVQLNGESLPTTPSPGSYLVLTRSWKSGDRVSINLPMHLRFEPMPDDRNTRAVMYGPLLLAARLGSNGLTLGMIYGPMGPDVRHHPTDLPSVPASANDPNALLKGRGTHPLEFHTEGLPRELEFAPLIQISGERYLVYLSFT